jgi:hypothetical protein
MTSNISTNHLDYADAAESAERGSAWPQASALWQQAIDLCDDSTHKATYQAGIDRCDAAAAVDRELASIAKRILQIPTLETRKSDQLDFHEVGVWSLQEALRLAYRLHRDAP